MTRAELRDLVLSSLNQKTNGDGETIETRCIFVVRKEESNGPRLIVYRDNSRKEWGYLLLNCHFDPFIPIKRQRAELKSVIARRLQLNPQRVCIEALYDEQLFVSIKPDLGAESKPTIYIYVFVFVRIYDLPFLHPIRRDTWTHHDGPSYPRYWKSIDDLNNDHDTMQSNADVINVLSKQGGGITHIPASFQKSNRYLFRVLWDARLTKWILSITSGILIAVLSAWMNSVLGVL